MREHLGLVPSCHMLEEVDLVTGCHRLFLEGHMSAHRAEDISFCAPVLGLACARGWVGSQSSRPLYTPGT